MLFLPVCISKEPQDVANGSNSRPIYRERVCNASAGSSCFRTPLRLQLSKHSTSISDLQCKVKDALAYWSIEHPYATYFSLIKQYLLDPCERQTVQIETLNQQPPQKSNQTYLWIDLSCASSMHLYSLISPQSNLQLQAKGTYTQPDT